MSDKINLSNRFTIVAFAFLTSITTAVAVRAEQAILPETATELENVELNRNTFGLWLNPGEAEVVFSFVPGCFPSESKDRDIDPMFTEGTAYSIHSEPIFFVSEESDSVAKE